MYQATGDPGDDPLERWLAIGYSKAYRTAYLILHDRHDAEEAVHDAFLRAWRFRAAVPEGDGVQPWMYRVVVNSCLSKLRSQRSAGAKHAPSDRGWDSAEASLASISAGPEELAEVSETKSAVVDALAGLPEHLRVVVVLRFYAGLSEKEIAAVVHRRPGTVKSRIHEAKLRLGRDPRLAAYRPADVLVGDGSSDD